MFWLAAHMWILLMMAFAIGLATGWWMRRPDPHERPAREETPLGSLDMDTPRTPDP